MAIQPKLEISHYHGDGLEDYAVFRVDRPSPLCSGITRQHAEHIVRILKKAPELPESISPIAEWKRFDYPLTDKDIERLGLTIIGDTH